jgi:ABC-type Fe3+ transport system permease subunit
LSLGEPGATLTVYPPGFATVPVLVVGQVERGYYLPASASASASASALSLILLLVSPGLAAADRGSRAASSG